MLILAAILVITWRILLGSQSPISKQVEHSDILKPLIDRLSNAL